ncbi:hypothetical protein [Tannerella sp.]|uniref:hypothetical protein n=1 Tax=Tannerella sp. TaxID=2382127 RepID=UPI0026DAB613|nr:hypothetical protein [Tannerella sp.]
MATMKNLMAAHPGEEQLERSHVLVTNLENELAGLIVNLTGDDRSRYGRVNEQNKLLINKVRDYAQISPSLRSPDVDWVEFERDYQSRNAMEDLILRLQNLVTGLKNNKTLHDFDNYQAALDDYSYTCYKAKTSVPGFEDKRKELKQFFPRNRKTSETPAPDDNNQPI